MSNHKRKLTVFLSAVLVLIWMIIIYNLSDQPAHHSNNLSKGITEMFVETVERIYPGMELSIDRLNHYVRKNAHFFTYLVLAILVMSVLKRSRRLKDKAIYLTLMICVLFSISDEVHQLFVPGRGGQVKDVFIDTFGAMVGIVLSIVKDKFRKSARTAKHPRDTNIK